MRSHRLPAGALGSGKGLLRADRLGEVAPAVAKGRMRGYRVYPFTPEKVGLIQRLKTARRERSLSLDKGEYRRTSAARVLGVCEDTLKRWEVKGKARPRTVGGYPIYTDDEIRRIAREQGRTLHW